jgi:predicted amidophosphoribosyltransferase
MWLDRLLGAGRELRQGVLHLLYPGCCLLCGEPLPAAPAHFCGRCRDAVLADPSPSCPRCAATVGPFAVADGRCGSCRHEALPYEQAVRLGPYDGRLREAVLRLKHQAGEGLAEVLGEHWAGQAADRFHALAVDALVPVPLYSQG